MRKTIWLVAFLVCFVSVTTHGQKLQVLIDNDAPASATEFEVLIKSKDPSIVSVLISSEDLPPTDWTTHKITEKEMLSRSLKTLPSKRITYSITAFSNAGSVVDTKRISFENSQRVNEESKKEKRNPSESDQSDGNDDSNKCSELVSALIKLVEAGEIPESRRFGAQELGKFGVDATCALGRLSKQLGKPIDEKFTAEVKKDLEASLTSIVRRAGQLESGSSHVSGTVKDEFGEAVDRTRVQVLGSSNEVLQETFTDDDGRYELNNVPAGATTIAPVNEAFVPAKNVPLGSSVGPKVRDLLLERKTLDRFENSAGGQFSRIILGFEQAGATASESRRNFFFDGFFSVPLPIKETFIAGKDGRPYLSFWGNPRIASAPDPSIDDLEIQEFVRDFADRAASTRVKNLVQTFELTAGLELTLTHPQRQLQGFERGIRNRFSFGLIAGAGIVAPINPRESIGTNIFEVTPEAVARYSQAAGKTYIAFVAPERDRFYRQYFAGVRLKTFYHTNGGRLANRYPATVDITFGQNEAITGGYLKGGVMKIEGFVPFPIKDFGSIFLFGTAQMKFSRPNFGDPLILRRADSSVTLPNSDTAVITILPQNRDYYRIGVGVDPVRLFKDFRNLGRSNNENAPVVNQ